MNIPGNPASFPAELPLLDDGTVPTAAEINVPIEALADRTAFLEQRMPFFASSAVTGSGPIVVPPGATHAIYDGCGGGAGGGSAWTSAGSGKSDSSGAGGGGARRQVGIIEVVPGEHLTVTIGPGGPGHAGGSGAANGTDGGDTTIVRDSDGTVLARMRGAAGGSRGSSNNAFADNALDVYADGSGGAAIYVISGGGGPVRGTSGTIYATVDAYPTRRDVTPQAGGHGISRGRPGDGGNSSPEGFDGGAGGGSGGVPDFLCYAGGGGGGGGAGPYGAGGAGGAGGAANSASDPGAGIGGSSAAVNTGAGGGGGGAPGATVAGSAASGGAGGNGGSGRLNKITFLRAS